MERALIVITAVLMLAAVGCKDNHEEAAAAKRALHDTIAQQNYDLDSKLTSVFIDTVQLKQGDGVAKHFLLDCQQKGYLVTIAEKDADGFTPHKGYTNEGQMPERRLAACNAIVTAENKIDAREAAKDRAAEAREKLKDAAYDTAHSKK